MSRVSELAVRFAPLKRPAQRPTGNERTARISIVVPARNAAETVARALESVLAQTSPRWDLIVVDDGSTDATAELVRSMVRDRADVQLVNGPGQGVSAARNLGTELARSPYVLYLDADDWIDERFVELTTEALDADPSLSGVRCVWAYETPDGRTEAWDDLDLSDLFAVSATRCPFAIHACVIERDLVRSLGGFDPELVVGEDWDLWQRVARAGARLGFVDEVLAYYLMRPESVMHTDFARVQQDLITVTERGQTADERVPHPLPQYRDGVIGDPFLDVEAEALAGTLAVAIPTDRNLAELIPGHPPDPTKHLTSDHIAGAIHESVAFGSCALLGDWPELYERWQDRLHEMLRLYADWLGRPEVHDEVVRVLEYTVAQSTDIENVDTIGRTAIRTIDLSEGVRDLSIPGDVDQLVAAVRLGSLPIGFVSTPIIGQSVDRRDLAEAIASHLGPRMASRARRDPRLAARMIRPIASLDALEAGARMLLDTPWDAGAGRRRTIELFLRWAARQASTGLVGTGWSDGAQSEPTIELSAPDEVDEDSYGETYFDEIFGDADPWLYGGNYEQTKYEQTLAVLGDRRFARGLELACAEGHFTVQLARRVDHLIAADISPTALERAAERCREHPGVEFRHVDLRDESFPRDLDLLVCSEVLYFVEEDEALADVGRRFADALAPGGLLLVAHANLIVDDPDKTGFDWGHGFGARRIGEIIAAVPGLRLVTSAVSELYRIQLFERIPDNGAPEPPTEVQIPVADDLDPHIRRMVLWGGAVKTREEAFATDVSDRMPILTYHRVAPDGPPDLDTYRVTPEAFEEQLAHLRTHGYYGITLEQWRWALECKRPLPGRCVLITFDDGYDDFREYAWPLLRDFEFPATVFVVTDLVGGSADWDARFGQPPSLMNWDDLRHLQQQGIEIGSHTATHHALTSLTPGEALAQEARARQTLRRELSREITSLAYPYGQVDDLVQTTMSRAGYDLAVTTAAEPSSVWHHPMAIPRIDIEGGDDLEDFVVKLGRRSRVNPLRRGLRRAKRRVRG